MRLQVGWEPMGEHSARYTMRCSATGMMVSSILKENPANDASVRNGGCFEIRVSITSNAGQVDLNPAYRRDVREALAHAELLVAKTIFDLREAGQWTGLAQLGELDDDTD